MVILDKIKTLPQRFSNHMLNRFGLLTSQQVSHLALNKAIYGLLPPVFDMDAAIEGLRKDYDTALSNVIFFNSDTLTPHWQKGQQPEDFPLTQEYLSSYNDDIGQNRLVKNYATKVSPEAVEQVAEQIVQLSEITSQNMFEDLQPDSTDFGTDLVMRYIFNHEAAHALDVRFAADEGDIAQTIRDENVADTFALLRLASEQNSPQLMDSFAEQLSKSRSKHALTYEDNEHLTIFTVDALMQNDFYKAASSTHDTLQKTYEHVEKFLPPADDLRKYDKNYKRFIKKWQQHPDSPSFFEAAYNEMIAQSKKQGTEEYDACFIYTAARFYKTYVTEGYAFHGKEQKYGNIYSEQDMPGMKAAFNKAVSTLEQDSHFKKFKIDTLKLG